MKPDGYATSPLKMAKKRNKDFLRLVSAPVVVLNCLKLTAELRVILSINAHSECF